MEKGTISGRQSEYPLGSGTPGPMKFYLLPKIHKDTKVWSLTFQIPSGKPIVLECNSDT